MSVTLGEMPEKWSLYVADCDASNVEPSFKDYLVWLDENNLNIVEEFREFTT